MKVTRVPIRRLEPGTSFTEVHLAGDAGIHHPLKRAVHRGATDSRMLAVDKADEQVEALFEPQFDKEDVWTNYETK